MILSWIFPCMKWEYFHHAQKVSPLCQPFATHCLELALCTASLGQGLKVGPTPLQYFQWEVVYHSTDNPGWTSATASSMHQNKTNLWDETNRSSFLRLHDKDWMSLDSPKKKTWYKAYWHGIYLKNVAEISICEMSYAQSLSTISLFKPSPSLPLWIYEYRIPGCSSD